MAQILKPIDDISPIYFKVHLRTLFYLGTDILPIKSKTLSFCFHIYSVSIISMMALFTLSEFLDMVLNFEDIYKMTFQLCYFVTHILGSVKMSLMLVLREKLWHHLDTLENGIFKPNLKRGGYEEFQLVKDAIKSCERQGYFFYTLVVGIVGARSIYAVLANISNDKHIDRNSTLIEPKIMPYPTWLPFEYNTSPYYELILAFQIFFMIIYGFYIGAADAVICGFLIMIKAQFLIVKREIETLLERAMDNSNCKMNESLNLETDTAVSKLTKDLVIHHQKLIALCDHSEQDFSYLMLLQFISSLIVISLQLFQLSALIPGSVEFFSMTMYLILMLFQLLCYCWHGNEVKLVSGKLSTDIFNINWVVMNKSVKKSLLLMMTRSQRPNYFTAGKFSLLSLETFTKIIRGAASYFMFLKQMSF